MKRCLGLFLAAPLLLPGAAAWGDDDPYADARHALVEVIRRDVQATRDLLRQPALDARVLQALGAVPRHEFVPPEQRSRAYHNRPLPIGYGQTISQPYVVAVMTELLKLNPGERALEVGTGSGYQAAILAHLGVRVYTIEIIPALGEAARSRLQRLGYDKVEVRIGDGYYGWCEAAPFDAIIVTAATNHIPPPLIEQLRPGGRMVIPVGNPFGTQQLIVVKKESDGHITTQKILPVRFVPLTGRAHP